MLKELAQFRKREPAGTQARPIGTDYGNDLGRASLTGAASFFCIVSAQVRHCWRVNMPGMRGPELAQRLLASRPGLKVLYVSGSDDAIDKDLLTRRADFLQKPFSTEEFPAKIREVLGSGL